MGRRWNKRRCIHAPTRANAQSRLNHGTHTQENQRKIKRYIKKKTTAFSRSPIKSGPHIHDTAVHVAQSLTILIPKDSILILHSHNIDIATMYKYQYLDTTTSYFFTLYCLIAPCLAQRFAKYPIRKHPQDSTFKTWRNSEKLPSYLEKCLTEFWAHISHSYFFIKFTVLPKLRLIIWYQR